MVIAHLVLQPGTPSISFDLANSGKLLSASVFFYSSLSIFCWFSFFFLDFLLLLFDLSFSLHLCHFSFLLLCTNQREQSPYGCDIALRCQPSGGDDHQDHAGRSLPRCSSCFHGLFPLKPIRKPKKWEDFTPRSCRCERFSLVMRGAPWTRRRTSVERGGWV